MATKQSRKELLNEPDEFLTFSDHAFKWVKENLRLVSYVAGGVVVAIAIVVGVIGWLEAQRQAAATALAAAYPSYAQAMSDQADAKQISTAIAAMQKVADEYGSAPSGMQARLAVGSLCLVSKDYAKAAKAFAGLTENSDAPKAMRALAWRGLGQSQEAGGDLKKAAETYQKALELAGPNLGDIVKMDKARVLAASGGKSEAEKLYRAMLASRNNAVLADEAKNRLVAMGVKP